MSRKARRSTTAETIIQLRLPTFGAAQAHALTVVLENLVREIWRTYGDAIADYLGCVDPDSMDAPPGSVSHWPNDSSDDIDF